MHRSPLAPMAIAAIPVERCDSLFVVTDLFIGRDTCRAALLKRGSRLMGRHARYTHYPCGTTQNSPWVWSEFDPSNRNTVGCLPKSPLSGRMRSFRQSHKLNPSLTRSSDRVCCTNLKHDIPTPSGRNLDQNPFNFIERHLILAAVIESGRTCGFVIGHLLCDFQLAAIA